MDGHRTERILEHQFEYSSMNEAEFEPSTKSEITTTFNFFDINFQDVVVGWLFFILPRAEQSRES